MKFDRAGIVIMYQKKKTNKQTKLKYLFLSLKYSSFQEIIILNLSVRNTHIHLIHGVMRDSLFEIFSNLLV